MITGLTITFLLWWGGDDIPPKVRAHANCLAIVGVGMGQACPALDQKKYEHPRP